jgi:hypothetical protein
MFMLYMCGVIAWSQTVEEYEWIDPGDMIFYDHNTQSMKNKPKAEVWFSFIKYLIGLVYAIATEFPWVMLSCRMS